MTEETFTVEVLLFEGFDELDGVGPFEVFESAGSDVEPSAPVSASMVTLDAVETVTASHGLEIAPDGTLGDPDLLVVPGGGWQDGGGVRREVEDGSIPAAVAEVDERGVELASVCTGAMLLAEAGVLDGRPAVTHRSARDDLAAVAEVVDARVVDDGDVVTAGGVTSGIDLALWMLEREFGAGVADAVAGNVEYERRGSVHRA
jgi:transcriptional regulator GlxA family with amidase domain